MPAIDHLGVYRVGDLKFYSKLEAIEMHARTGHHPHWDFNEAVFSSYDWTQEPKESIQELYRQRAQQLRDRYDYIVLFWSGGADSENVRRSFMDNDIKLDELVSLSNYDASRDKMDFFNCELFNRTLPKSKQLQEQYPWIRFRVIDQSQDTVEYFNRGNRFDWIYNSNMMLTPNCASRDGIGMKVKEWADMVMQGQRLCLLWGHDKPRLFHENGKYLVKFLDIVDNGPTVSSIAGQQPYSDELFYWTPDLPKIIIKQAHLVKRYLDENLFRSPFISTNKSDLAFKIHEGRKYWLDNHGLHTIIYPGWDINTFDPGKTNSMLFSPRDQWFFDLEQDNLSRKIWQDGVGKLAQALPDYWKNDPTDISKGIKACWSRDYYLE